MRTTIRQRFYKKSTTFLCALLFCSSFLTGCRIPWRYDIHLHNASGHDIGWLIQMVDDGKYYPDTTLLDTFIRPNYGNDWDRFGDALLFGGFCGLKDEKAVIHFLSPSDTLSVFIFHTDTLKAYPWETIRDEYKILVRYDLSWEDIRAVNYHVPYPPTFEMERMHMWPPFEEVLARYQ